jgi:hydroxyethylthiazole kinase-like uncharacterized protein yjeF
MDISDIYKKRAAWSKKGDFGKLLVVGGSKDYSGSPVFNALAAYRAGCDIVKIAAPEKAARIAKSFKPDMIAFPLDGEYLSAKHVPKIMELQRSCDAMVIGGGLTRGKSVLSAVSLIIKKTKIPAVVDADGLHAVKTKLNSKIILTPHTQEFYVLSGKRLTTDINERISETKKLALKLSCTILLKGHVDVVSDGKNVHLNKTGSVFMTKGGFGDTLAGIAGALLARGLPAYDAACIAAKINGLAGSLAAKRRGEGVLASDLIEEIPDVIR